MKRKYLYIAVILLIIAGMLVFILPGTGEKEFDPTKTYFYKTYGGMEPEEIYDKIKDRDGHDILDEFIKIEDEIGMYDPELFIYLPFAMVISEKWNEFEPDEIIDLIKSETGGPALEYILIEIYGMNETDLTALEPLLEEDAKHVSDLAKLKIFQTKHMTEEEVLEYFEQRKDAFIGPLVMHMKNCLSEDVFFEKIFHLFETAESEEETKACVKYASDLYLTAKKKKDDVSCAKIPELLDHAYETIPDAYSRIQVVRQYASMKDMSRIRDILHHTDYDRTTKNEAVDAAVPYFSEVLLKQVSDEDLACILEAMNLYPVKGIDESLKYAVEQGNIKDSSEVRKTIQYIEKNGKQPKMSY